MSVIRKILFDLGGASNLRDCACFYRYWKRQDDRKGLPKTKNINL